MSKRIFRVHTFEAVYVGPKEPNATFPPGETMQMPDRATEWSFEAAEHGVVITQKNPRATHREVAGKKVPTPLGQVWQTLVPWSNVRDVQYEEEPIAASAQTKIKGAA